MGALVVAIGVVEEIRFRDWRRRQKPAPVVVATERHLVGLAQGVPLRPYKYSVNLHGEVPIHALVVVEVTVSRQKLKISEHFVARKTIEDDVFLTIEVKVADILVQKAAIDASNAYKKRGNGRRDRLETYEIWR